MINKFLCRDVIRDINYENFLLYSIFWLSVILSGRVPLALYTSFLLGIFYYVFDTLAGVDKYKKSFIKLTLSIPFSYVPILPAIVPRFITWFTISCVVYILCLIVEYKDKNKLLINKLALFIITMLTLNFFTHAINLSSINMYIHLLLFFIITGLDNSSKKFSISEIKQFYLMAVFFTAVFILIQGFALKFFNIELGFVKIFNGGLGKERVAFAGFFRDFSYASLYVLTGIPFIVKRIFQPKTGTSYMSFVAIIIIIISSILTTARTGLFSLMLIFIISLSRLLVQNKKNREQIFKIILGGTISFLIIILLYYRINTRTWVGFFYSNGRIKLALESLEYIFYNPFFGVGLGSINYGSMLVHNYILQYLSHTGILLGSLMVIYPFIYLCIKNNLDLKYSFLLIFIGGMLIPNLYNISFVIVIVLMLSFEKTNKNSNLWYEISFQ